MPLCINREYKPTRSLDLETIDLERSFWGTYVDDQAQAEFYRFVNRGIAPTITGMMFGPGAMMYALLNTVGIRATGLTNYIGYIVSGVITALVNVVDLYLLWRKKTLDTSAAWWRSRFDIVYCVAICWSVGHPFTGIQVECATTTDYLGYLYDRPPFDPADRERQCIDYIIPYVIVGYGLGMTVLNVTPRWKIFFFLLHLASLYSGYGVYNMLIFGESVRELIAKAVVYVTFGTACSIVKLVRYRAYQSQFETTLAADRERRRATRAADEVDGMLQAMVPASALERLLAGEIVRDSVESASVLFSDMAGFTAWSSTRTAAEVVEMLNVVCTRLDAEAEARGVVKIKTIGDAYWAVTGIPEELGEHVEVLCGFAQRMHSVVAEEVDAHPHWGGVVLRAGVASGPVEGGIFGTSRLSYEVSGPTCDLAALCEQRGVPQRVCVCSRTRALLDISVEAPDEHVAIEAPGGGTEQLWLLREARFEVIMNSSGPTSVKSASAGSRSTIASTVVAAPGASDAAAAAKRRFLAARAAIAAAKPDTSEDSDDKRAPSHVDAVHRSAGGSRKPSLRPMGTVSTHLHQLNDDSVSKATSGDALPDHQYADVNEDSAAAKAPGQVYAVDLDVAEVHVESVGGAEAHHANCAAEPASTGAANEIGKRRFNWVLMNFVDPEFEKEYQVFVAQKHQPVRRVCAVVLVAIIAALAIGLVVEGTASDAGAIATFAVGGTMACCSLVVALMGLNPLIDAAMMQVTAVLVIAGMWQLEWQSLFGHDVMYLHAALSIPLGFGIASWPSALVLLLNFWLMLVPVAAQTVDSIWATGNVLNVLFSILMFGFAFVQQEKHLRRQFVELAITKSAIDAQGQRALEQEALLLAIVPPHAVGPLTTWLSKGKDATHAVNDMFTRLNVGFIRLVANGDSDNLAVSWLFAAHTAVDAVLDTYARWLDKVKTMGDTVMVAGPFRSTHDESDAEVKTDVGAQKAAQRAGGQQPETSVQMSAVALLEAMRELRDASDCFICGLHVGEVMGVVLGTSRLCYDIFGDSVNTASRTMASLKGALIEDHGAGANCAVSAEYRDLVAPAMDSGSLAGVQLSDARSAQAKGKASLEVHAVHFDSVRQ